MGNTLNIVGYTEFWRFLWEWGDFGFDHHVGIGLVSDR